jgi:hypothetical protein
MPVIIVKDWNKMDNKFLEKNYNQLKYKKFNFNILLMKNWINLINQNKVKANKKMLYKSFVNLI